MVRRLDGLHSDNSTPPRPPKKHSRIWRRLLLWAFLILVLPVGLLSLWAQPILAALPLDFQSKLTLARLAKPGVYLVLFQNQRELRPTGGFLGSFAEVEIGWGGKLKSIQVETNIYRRDAAYADKLQREAPEPMREFLGDKAWALRDSNWALDFPEAAQMVSWFYAQEGGREVDGVIALEARLLERLLALTGPIALIDYDVNLTSVNVVDALMTEIEQDYWLDPTHSRENQPKTVLADLLPLLLAKLTSLPEKTLVAEAVQAFRAKEVMIYHRDPTLGQTFATANWDGHLAAGNEDFLYVNEANLTPVNGLVRTVGAKSSWSIDRALELTRSGSTESSSHHTLTLSRDHRGTKAWPDGPNASYLRLAVPSGSTLISASRNGVDITSEVRFSLEAGKSVFGFWSRLEPGQAEELRFDYRAPVSVTADLLLQRQPGMPGYPVTILNREQVIWRGSLDADQKISAS